MPYGHLVESNTYVVSSSLELEAFITDLKVKSLNPQRLKIGGFEINETQAQLIADNVLNMPQLDSLSISSSLIDKNASKIIYDVAEENAFNIELGNEDLNNFCDDLIQRLLVLPLELSYEIISRLSTEKLNNLCKDIEEKLLNNNWQEVLLNSENNSYTINDISKMVDKFSHIKEYIEDLLSRERVKVIAGSFSTFVINRDELLAIGSNSYGQLGLGHTISIQYPETVHDVSGQAINTLSCGRGHSLLLTESGLYSTGYNISGQLGLGIFENKRSWQKVSLPLNISIPDIIDIFTGNYHSVLHTKKGLLSCGHNGSYQLGLGHKEDISSFQEIELPYNINVDSIIKVAVGGYHTLILTDSGLYSVGDNCRGQLGVGGYKASGKIRKAVLPLGVSPSSIVGLYAGGNHTIILTTKGIYSCGFNRYGQLGLGHNIDCNSFQRVELPKDIETFEVLSVICGDNFTVVRTKHGVFSCGANECNQLGQTGVVRVNVLTLCELPDNVDQKDIIRIVAGEKHLIMITTKGVFGLGSNSSGQLGLVKDLKKDAFSDLTSISHLAFGNRDYEFMELYKHHFIIGNQSEAGNRQGCLSSLKNKIKL